MTDRVIQAWSLVALVIIVVHMLFTLIQVCDLWWAWRQPNRRAPRYFRRARWRLIITMLFLIIGAALVVALHITH